jgi:hypothetical protein
MKRPQMIFIRIAMSGIEFYWIRSVVMWRGDVGAAENGNVALVAPSNSAE